MTALHCLDWQPIPALVRAALIATEKARQIAGPLVRDQIVLPKKHAGLVADLRFGRHRGVCPPDDIVEQGFGGG